MAKSCAVGGALDQTGDAGEHEPAVVAVERPQHRASVVKG